MNELIKSKSLSKKDDAEKNKTLNIPLTEDTLTKCSPITSALPVELLFKIFVYVGERDLGSVASTCRVINTMVNDNAIWKELFKISFPEIILPGKTTNWRSELLWQKGAARRKARYSFNQMYGLCGRIPQKPDYFIMAPSYFEYVNFTGFM
jgi:hypothetical protein